MNKSEAVFVLLEFLANEGQNKVESRRRANQGTSRKAFDEGRGDGGRNTNRCQGKMKKTEETISVGTRENIRSHERVKSGVKLGVFESVRDDEGEKAFESQDCEKTSIAVSFCQRFGKKKWICKPRNDAVVDIC